MSIEFKKVRFWYERGLPWEKEALSQINLLVSPGEVLGIIGPTGSGKSTLLQLMNGLLIPGEGRVLVDGQDTSKAKGRQVTRLRQQVGLVFQFPEDQLFERTVFEDVAFGPRNLNLEEGEVYRRVKWALDTMKLDFDSLRHRPPATLSGGQKRRVAIAGVLAMQPKYMALDEPGAGLDPEGRRLLLSIIRSLRDHLGIGVILVSHRIQDVFAVCDRVAVLVNGSIAAAGSPRELLGAEAIEPYGLALPPLNRLLRDLKSCYPDIRTDLLDINAAAAEIDRVLRNEPWPA
jgi:energy-coupling factor transport system ATP-binding protein